MAQNNLRLYTGILSLWYYGPCIWDIVVTVSIIPSLFFVTLQLFYNAGIPWQWAVIYVTDMLYLAHIVVQFFRSYTQRGVEITCKKKIAIHYLSHSFFPDLISILPFELFSAVASNSMYVSAFLRLNRCIRSYRVWSYLCKCSVLVCH